MQTSIPTNVARPFNAPRRTVAIVLAAAAATGVAAIAVDDESPVRTLPSNSPVKSSGVVSELSTYDGELLRHHGIKVLKDPVSVAPTGPAADRFHHFR